MILKSIRLCHWENASLRAGLALLALATTFADRARAEVYLPALGGVGGGQFKAPCPPGQNLTGFELRAGDDVDAIRPACVTAYGPSEVTAPALTTDSGLVYTPGPLGTVLPQVAPGWYGGPGGGIHRVLCPASTPIVIGMEVRYDGGLNPENKTVNTILLFCGVAAISLDQWAGYPHPYYLYPSAIFEPPLTNPGGGVPNSCPPGQVAVGVHGRAGKYLDAIGLICDAARIAPPPPGSVKAVGRVRGVAAPTGPPISICEAARQARERNSPAAPGLEAQCRAQTPTVKALGRVQTSQPSGTPLPICDAAAAARDRNSPAAPGLLAQCLALGGHLPAPATPATGMALNADELAAKGEIIATGDPFSTELRNQQPAGPIRRGFDIGMAAAAGDTAWGPGKQKILDSLAPAEQEGFKVAASFSLDRNRNAELAATGAAIAEANPTVAAARGGEVDVRYWLGFDIATGIFGDPALGAKGNTATGPGSLKIRDALSAPAQRGFNASVAFHLSRKYTK